MIPHGNLPSFRSLGTVYRMAHKMPPNKDIILYVGVQQGP